MKIVHLVNNFSTNGGVGSYLLRISQAQKEAGHEIHVLHRDKNAQSIKGICDHYISGFGLYPKMPEVASKKAFKILEDLKPDIVHFHVNGDYSFEEKVQRTYSSIKSIHVYEFCPSGTKFHHRTNEICEHKSGPMCLVRMYSHKCTLAKKPTEIMTFYTQCMSAIQNDQRFPKIFVASQYVKEQAILNGYREEQIEILPYFAQEPTGVPSEREIPTVLFSGRIHQVKGLAQLIRSLTFLPKDLEYKLLVDGDGPDLESCKQLTAKLKLESRVEFVGWLEQEPHWEAFRSASVVVVPSIWPEPFGLIGIEAMQYEKPLLGFKVGGIQDWVREGENGYLVEPSDLRAMASRLEQLIKDKALRESLGRRGKEIVQKEYSKEAHLQHLTQSYESIARKDKAA